MTGEPMQKWHCAHQVILLSHEKLSIYYALLSDPLHSSMNQKKHFGTMKNALLRKETIIMW